MRDPGHRHQTEVLAGTSPFGSGTPRELQPHSRLLKTFGLDRPAPTHFFSPDRRRRVGRESQLGVVGCERWQNGRGGEAGGRVLQNRRYGRWRWIRRGRCLGAEDGFVGEPWRRPLRSVNWHSGSWLANWRSTHRFGRWIARGLMPLGRAHPGWCVSGVFSSAAPLAPLDA